MSPSSIYNVIKTLEYAYSFSLICQKQEANPRFAELLKERKAHYSRCRKIHQTELLEEQALAGPKSLEHLIRVITAPKTHRRIIQTAREAEALLLNHDSDTYVLSPEFMIDRQDYIFSTQVTIAILALSIGSRNRYVFTSFFGPHFGGF